MTTNFTKWRLTYITRILFELSGNLVRGTRPGDLRMLAHSRNSDTRVRRRCLRTTPYLFQTITYLVVIKSEIRLKRVLCPYNVPTCCQGKSARASLRAECFLLWPCMCLILYMCCSVASHSSVLVFLSDFDMRKQARKLP